MRSKSCIKNLICFFLVKGGMFGFLLVFLFQNFSAQIYVSGNALIHVDNNVDVYISDSDSQPSAKIYVSSGTVITNLEHHGKYEIITTKKPEINNPENILANTKIDEVVSTNNKVENRITKIASEKHIGFSTAANSEIFFTKLSKTTVTLVPVNSASSKIAEVFSKSNLNIIHFLKGQSGVFLYSDCFVNTYLSNNFSARPPPQFS